MKNLSLLTNPKAQTLSYLHIRLSSSLKRLPSTPAMKLHFYIPDNQTQTTLESREIGAKGTLKKSCLPPRWRLLMVQGIQCLGGKTSGLDQISNKDATILYCLANRIKVDYARLIWEDIIHKLSKKTREKVVHYPRFISFLLEYMMPKYENEELTINPTQVFSIYNWALNPNQTEGPPFTDHMKTICNLDVPVDPKLINLPHKLRRFAKAKSLELKVDSEENNLENTHLSLRLRHPNPELADQKKKLTTSNN
ncbi:hypothetical protein Tco_1077681, partial [Tanacetum coccineum]